MKKSTKKILMREFYSVIGRIIAMLIAGFIIWWVAN